MKPPPLTQHERQDAIDRLQEKAEQAGLEADSLDDLVHELASSIAAEINNSGMDEQLGYLIDEMGAQATERQLDELIARRTRQPEEDE